MCKNLDKQAYYYMKEIVLKNRFLIIILYILPEKRGEYIIFIK